MGSPDRSSTAGRAKICAASERREGPGSEGQGRFTKVLEEMTRVALDHGQIQPDDTTLLGLIDAYLRLDDMYCIVLALC